MHTHGMYPPSFTQVIFPLQPALATSPGSHFFILLSHSFIYADGYTDPPRGAQQPVCWWVWVGALYKVP